MWFQRASELPNAPNWLKPLAASVLGAGSDRASARFLWNQILQSEEEWLRRNAGACPQPARRRRRRRPVAGDRQPVSAARRWAVLLGALVRRRVLRGIPLDPVGTPFELDPATGRVVAVEELEPFPVAAAPADSALMTDATLALIGLAILGLAVGSFLNVCIHRLPRGESIVRPGSRCPHCGYVLRLVGQRSGAQLPVPRRQLPQVPGADLDSLPDRRARDDGDLTSSTPTSSVSTSSWCRGSLFATALDRPLCDRSRAPPAAERHHPARHRRRPGLQRLLPLPPGIVDSLIGILAGAGSCGWSARRTTDTPARRGWAAATSRCWR